MYYRTPKLSACSLRSFSTFSVLTTFGSEERALALRASFTSTHIAGKRRKRLPHVFQPSRSSRFMQPSCFIFTIKKRSRRILQIGWNGAGHARRARARTSFRHHSSARAQGVHLTDHLATGHHLSGIFIIKPDLSVRQTLDDLILIACASLEREFADRITFLPVG